MEEYSAHWKNTLMGADFWKDAAIYEEEVAKKLQRGTASLVLISSHLVACIVQVLVPLTSPALTLNLHNQFPFNMGAEQGRRLQDIPKKRRRLSTADLLTISGLRRHPSVKGTTARIKGLARHVRTGSFKAASTLDLKLSIDTTSKVLDAPKSTTARAVEIVSPPPVTLLSSPTTLDLATPVKLILLFRGGPSWAELPRIKSTLELDLFSTIDKEEKDDGILTIVELKPLCEFRNLRSLKLTGMLRSYQLYIWQAVWLNTKLETLVLGMALEPDIFSAPGSQWKQIKTGWKMSGRMYADPVYYGHYGIGELNPDIGYGEYLDKHAIEKAKICAMAMGPTVKRLRIKSISLSGFVVDGDPFLHWFDPEKLRTIHFKAHCVDAGLWLPRNMRSVTIRLSKPFDLEAVPTGLVKLNLLKDLNMITLKKGRKVSQVPFEHWQKEDWDSLSSPKSRSPSG
ncbi:hypothetical protein PENANT_c018G02503 [Penicillium antarcticum]|uniref:Uncharacterized protein n=1 Tax=Penicillium antarcticum TaxID=416450 RepID=A0A1V6Q1S3_9EURO|nr:uncharacterized protein N7508_003892 [Penicillium antarcticum]KAJ5313062.1 hypothetical protein N7508_003892 [Penicillium antarcticum]OQD83193.1 hypothetical protein PENANT_c018G02503 [Penicillium antarcticum]